jgi:hypothetical protein
MPILKSQGMSPLNSENDGDFLRVLKSLVYILWTLDDNGFTFAAGIAEVG